MVDLVQQSGFFFSFIKNYYVIFLCEFPVFLHNFSGFVFGKLVFSLYSGAGVLIIKSHFLIGFHRGLMKPF